MPFVPMSELLAEAYAAGYAVPAFCVWCPEAMQTVLQVAREMGAPVILMNGPAEFPCLAPSTLAAAAHELIARYPAQAGLHLDHGESLERVQQCLDAGYTSVMLDYSTRPLAENMAALREVCSLAHPLGVTVEGEIGVVGKVEASVVEGSESSALTDPAEAAEYVAATGVDALAVAIGNAHGQYARLPRLDFPLLERLRQAVPVPLVLHGGSGTPDSDLQRAISLGIAKVNVATDLVAGVRESLLRQWQQGRNPWIPSAQAEAMGSMAGVVAGWIRRTGAAGRA